MIVAQSENANGKAAGTAQQCGPCCFLQSQKKPMRLGLRPSGDDKAAVDGEDLAGDEGGVGQVAHGLGDILRGAVTADGRLFLEGSQDRRVNLPAHVRQNDAGGDGVDTDVAGTQLLGQGLRQRQDSALRRGIGGLTGGADLPPHGRDIDDAACLPGQHPGQDGVDAVIDASDIHVKEPLPLLGRDLGDQAGVADSGVVDENLRLLQLRGQTGDGVAVGDIAAQGSCTSAAGDGLGGLVVSMIKEGDIVTPSGEGRDSCRADAPGAAGD